MKVVFNESNHTYKLGEKILISVTRLLKKHKLSPDYSAVDPDVLKRAAGKGIAVHKEIENYIKNGDIGFTQELQDFITICDELGFVPEKSEIILPDGDIPDEEVNDCVCAGTADLIGKINGEYVIADIKATSSVDKRAYAWQLSLYERLAGITFSKMYIFHLCAESKAIPIERIDKVEIDRLLDCERRGEIYQEPGLMVAPEILECALQAENELKAAEAASKAAKAKADEYRQKLYELMTAQGLASFETLDKTMLITRIAPSTKTTIDQERLRADMPEIAAKYVKTSKVKGYCKITIRGEK